MADISITAANVGLTDSSGITYRIVQYGEATTQGRSLYLKAADGKYWLANAGALAAAAAVGIALTPGAADEYGIMVEEGPIDLGTALASGATYVVSSTSGGIAPVADLTTGDYTTILGVALASNKLDLRIYQSGVIKAGAAAGASAGIATALAVGATA